MVYFRNEYQLPPRFEPDDIVIDVGAHIGSFTYACCIRSVGQVIAVEAHPQNFGRASIHLHQAIQDKQVDLRWGAVWRSDDHSDSLDVSAYEKMLDGRFNTGHVTIEAQEHPSLMPVFALDNLIQEQAPCRIRLLKLDCEGAEFPILLTSNKLQFVSEIVGEFHETDNTTINSLVNHLQKQGFDAEHKHHQRYENGVWIPTQLGYFRAVR